MRVSPAPGTVPPSLPVVQVALHHNSQMLPGLLGRKSAAVALAVLGHLTQFLQDAAEEVVVLLW